MRTHQYCSRDKQRCPILGPFSYWNFYWVAVKELSLSYYSQEPYMVQELIHQHWYTKHKPLAAIIVKPRNSGEKGSLGVGRGGAGGVRESMK